MPRPDKPVPTSNGPATGERSRPGPMLAGMWATVLFFALLSAKEIDSLVTSDPALSNTRWLHAAAAGLIQVSDACGASALHDGIEALSQTPRITWLQKTPAPRPTLRDREPTTPTASTPAPDAGALACPPTDTRPVRRVLVVGESSIQFSLGAELERLFASFYSETTVSRFGKLATSLVREDYFDWPRKLRELVSTHHPDLVIGNFGGNDAQNIKTTSRTILRFGTPEWDEAYRERLDTIVDIVRAAGARLALIGMPTMRDSGFSKRMQHVNAVVERQMRLRGETYVSTWDLTADAAGAYKKSVRVDGATGLMRLSDGKHYSRLGAVYVARAIAERLERHFVLVPSNPSLAVALHRRIASPASDGGTEYIAYVPQKALREAASLPVLFLFCRAQNPASDCAARAHRELQDLATRHEIVIVTPAASDDGHVFDAGGLGDATVQQQLVSELIPDVECGLPVGGARSIVVLSPDDDAVSLAKAHPGLFVSAGSLSRSVDLVTGKEAGSPAVDADWLARLAQRVAWHAAALHRNGGPDVSPPKR
jgi:uncharacterized protein